MFKNKLYNYSDKKFLFLMRDWLRKSSNQINFWQVIVQTRWKEMAAMESQRNSTNSQQDFLSQRCRSDARVMLMHLLSCHLAVTSAAWHVIYDIWNTTCHLNNIGSASSHSLIYDIYFLEPSCYWLIQYDNPKASECCSYQLHFYHCKKPAIGMPAAIFLMLTPIVLPNTIACIDII